MTRMRSRAALLAMLLLAAILPGCIEKSDDETPVGGGGAEPAEWTFMVYLDADNNLEGPGIEDLNEMEEAGSTDDVNIVALFDRHVDYDTTNDDWTNARLYYVTPDNDTDIINSQLIEDYEELNMGDPRTLSDFVLDAMERWPAEHYALSVWNHGAGFYGIAFDEDDGNGGEDHLDMDKLEQALATIYNESGEKIDVIGFDACLMGEAAVQYSVAPYVDYMAASQTTEAGDGWPYELIAGDLIADPLMEPAMLARTIAQRYVEDYGADILVTQAAWDISRIPELYHDIDVLAELLIDRLNTPGEKIPVWDARENTESADPPRATPYMPDVLGYPMYDLWDFCYELKTRMPLDTELIDACNNVQAAIDYARIWEGHSQEKRDFHGLTIYFPDNSSSVPYDERFEETSFARDRLWDDFLRAYNEE